MKYVDYYCRKCDKKFEDVEVQNPERDVAFCPHCENSMERLYTKMSFKSKFKGSHNGEYGNKK